MVHLQKLKVKYLNKMLTIWDFKTFIILISPLDITIKVKVINQLTHKHVSLIENYEKKKAPPEFSWN